MSSPVRISARARAVLRQLAQETGATMTDVLDAALESYRRQHFLQRANLAYAVLAEDSVAFKAYRDENSSLDGTLNDRLENFP